MSYINSAILLVLMFACSSPQKSRSDKFTQMIKGQIPELEISCNQGNKQDCSKLLSSVAVIEGVDRAKTISNDRCKNGEEFFCYGIVKTLAFAGHDYEAKKLAKEQCDQGLGYSCYLLGIGDFNENTLETNEYIERAAKLNDAKAMYLSKFKKITQKNYNNSEIEKMLILFDKKNEYLLKLYVAQLIRDFDLKMSLKILQKICKDGNIEGCFYSEMMSNREKYNIQENTSSLLRDFCDKGSSFACYSNAKVGGNNHNWYDFYMDKACTLGNVDACANVGLRLENAKNNEGAELLYKYACYNNNLEACNYLGRLLDNKKGGIEAFKFSCIAGNKLGCLNVAIKDRDKKQNDYALSACDGNYNYGCYLYGVSLHKNKMKEKSEVYFKKACDSKEGVGCLGLCLLRAEENKLSEAKEYLVKGCGFATSSACEDYKTTDSKKLDISINKVKNLCHYDPDKPWWFWPGIVGIGLLSGQLVK